MNHNTHKQRQKILWQVGLPSVFVAAWLPGSEGQGVAEVQFGEHDFRGHLSFARPRCEADLGKPATQ